MKLLSSFTVPQKPVWLLHCSAAALFVVLTLWHFQPALPLMKTHVPGGGTVDVYDWISAPLSTTRSFLRNPFTYWRGDLLYPYPYSNTLNMGEPVKSFGFYTIWLCTKNAVLTLNIYILLLFAADALCVYLLVFTWRRSWLSAIIAGAFCAFFPHRFHYMGYHQDIFLTALALLAWIVFLRRGGTKYLVLFFVTVALKAIAPIYQTIFLFMLLSLAVPAGFIAYPQRLRQYWRQFLALSILLGIVLIPFYCPYLAVFRRLSGHGWRGVLFLSMDSLGTTELEQAFTRFLYNITHLRQRFTPTPFIPLWPGAVFIVTAAVSLAWTLVTPWIYGRRAVLRLAVLAGAAIGFVLAFANYIPLGDFGMLSRLYIDPPVLSVVRNPNAFVFSMMLCICILIGLSAADCVVYFHGRSHWAGWCITGILILILFFGTLEHTVALRPVMEYKECHTLPAVYNWIKQQTYPSPYIVFPYSTRHMTFKNGAIRALTDQPAAHGHERYPLPMKYYFEQFNNTSPEDMAAMIAVSPYRYWVQERTDEAYRQRVKQASDITCATNFGHITIFENPRIERVYPVEIVITQKWPQSLPNIIYSMDVQFIITNAYSFIPEHEREIRATCRFLDAATQELARISFSEELPFILDGPCSSFMFHIRYNAAEERIEGRFMRYGIWRIAKAPVGTAAVSEKIFNARWIDVSVRCPGTGRQDTCMGTIRPPSARWPYQWGVPVAYANQAEGFGWIEKEGSVPLQRSEGDHSTLYLSKPRHTPTGLVIRAKSAVTNAPNQLEVVVLMNGIRLDTIALRDTWQDFHLVVPGDAWREVNRFDFQYPETYIPCFLGDDTDENRRCAAFQKLYFLH